MRGAADSTAWTAFSRPEEFSSAITAGRSYPETMRPDCEEVRIAAFRFMIDRSVHIPEEEYAVLGALGIVVASYLIGSEKLLYERAEKIAVVKDGSMYRRSKERKTKKSKRKVRFRSVATILAIAIYFEEMCQSKEMVDILGLLASLAVDGSEGELSNMAQELVVSRALADEDIWNLLEAEFPTLCRLIENEAH